MIYTSVEKFKSDIYYRYIDNGVHHKEKLNTLELELFVRSNVNTDSISLYGDNLHRKSFNTLFDFSNFQKDAKQNQQMIFGMTNPVIQFISNEYQEDIVFDINQIRIINLDIETRIPDDGTFDKPTTASQPIVSITAKLFGDYNYYIFSTIEYETSGDTTYIKCEDEKDLLIKFLEYYRKCDVDIITGWNVETYDMVFIITRLNNILGEEYSNLLSPFSAFSKECIQEVRNSDETVYKILGVTILDYLKIYKKFSLGTLDSYRLDRVAEHELSENKLDYSEFKNLNELFDKDPQKFLDYNKHDVTLVERLDKKLNFINMILTVAYDGKINYEDVFSQTRFWHSKIYNELKKRGIQIPPKESHSHVNIPGGFVKDVQKGKHKWVCSFDLNSLYPNIIRLLNLSPETLAVEMGVDLIEDFIQLANKQTSNYCLAANSSKYRKDVLGIMPELLTKASESRVMYKNQMLEVRKEVEKLKSDNASYHEIKKKQDLVVRLDSLQNAKKVALNSAYGAMACPHFFLFNPSIASAITMTGQSIIRYLERRVNEFLNSKLKTTGHDYVILSDTDSLAFTLDKLVNIIVPVDKLEDTDYIQSFITKYGTEILNPFIASCLTEFEDYVNAYERTLKMKMENVADSAICIAKKNYVFSVLWSEGTKYKDAKLKMMGISVARSSIPVFCKPHIINCIKICLYGTESELQDYIKDFKSEYLKASIEQIALPRSISDIDKWILNDVTWKSGTPIHVKCSIVYNHLIKRLKIAGDNPEIVNGSKMKFVYIKEPNEFHNNAIAFIDKYPKEFNNYFVIDYNLMFEKGFLDPVKAFTKVLSWQDEKINTLDMFF